MKTKLLRAIQKIANTMRFAPSVPAPEDEAAAEPAPENEATAKPTTVKPASAMLTGSSGVRLDLMLDNPDRSRSLSTGHVANRTDQQRQWQHTHFLVKTLPCTFRGNGNDSASRQRLRSPIIKVDCCLVIHRQCKKSGSTVCRATRRTSD